MLTRLLPFMLMTVAAHATPFELVDTDHAAVSAVERYALQINAKDNAPYAGRNARQFPQGFPLAPGSGITLKQVEKDGSLTFWSLTDRGPNGDSPSLKQGDDKVPTKVFAAPGYVPQLVQIRVQLAEAATVTGRLPLSRDGKPMSGLPLKPGNTGSTGEVALTDALQPTLGYSERGVDPEGVAQDKDGNLWLADEYGPFLLHVDSKSGAILRQLAPGAGLPEVLKFRQPNRGFEGVAVAPSGKVYAAVQSTLDIDGKSKNKAGFTRIVEFDPQTGATRMLGYPIDTSYKKPGDAKIGDLVAIDDTHLLTIEQGKGADKVMRNIVYIIDLAAAGDLAGKKTADGKELEFASADELAKVKLAGKTRVLDLRELGWPHEKAEGLALFDGGIVVTNDNDFGLKASLESGDVDGAQIVDGKLVGGSGYQIKPSQEASELWLIHLKQPLKQYYAK